MSVSQIQLTVRPVLRATQIEDQKLVFKTHYRLMHVDSIAECSKLPFAIKTFVYLFLSGCLRQVLLYFDTKSYHPK